MTVPVTADSGAAYLHTACGNCGAHGRVALRSHEAHAVATTLLAWVDRMPRLQYEIPEGAGGKWWKR